MAKQLKKRSCPDKITISSIYEAIQSHNFRQSLWLDLISDIKEKPTYKRIKGMVDSLIQDTVSEFESEPAETLKRRTALTEISIMTYTVDTVISELLHRTYENEFKNLVADIIEKSFCEAEQKGALKLNLLMNKENGENSSNPQNQQSASSKNINQPAPVRKRGRPPKTATKNAEHDTVETAVEAKSSSKLSNPHMQNTTSVSNDLKPVTVVKKKRGRPRKSDIAESNSVGSEACNRNVKAAKNIKSLKRDDSASDESDFSMESVSSVHTSELSSFEDSVSIGSDDEATEKKRVPLKVASDLYLSGQLSEIYHLGKKAEEISKKPSYGSKHLSVKKEKLGTASSTSTQAESKRIRKPNSKYNSEDAYSPTKTSNAGQASSREKAQIKRTLSDEEILPQPSKASSPPKSSHQHYDTSDLYKPRPVIGRKTSQS